MLLTDHSPRVSHQQAQQSRQIVEPCPTEPTAALDLDRARRVLDLLQRVAIENEASANTVTHDEKITSCFDRLVSLRDGRIDA